MAQHMMIQRMGGELAVLLVLHFRLINNNGRTFRRGKPLFLPDLAADRWLSGLTMGGHRQKHQKIPEQPPSQD